MNMVLTFTDELHTIKNIYQGITQGDDPRYAVGTFLNDFFDYHAEARQALIADPIVVEEHPQPEHWRWALFCVASIEYLCQQYVLDCPTWVHAPMYATLLSDPWFFVPTALHNPAVRERYERETPAPFTRRNIFCGSRILMHKKATHRATAHHIMQPA
ncbi:hypothetical protein [Dictyobacter formicarum]|uniref:Uncharacterized protein n=1 Tax=Dictyobacter formicarum TaxID=2778368 RepID=A0ABQ3VCA8_9CHLR|nr:hypothetical protein [Dictyobacter formicarum]GHO83762.1 hypothetical protein KSZ_17680 [Dictyobacter formicarum]